MVPELLYMAAFAAHDDGKLSDVRASYYKKSGNSHALTSLSWYMYLFIA